MTVKAVWHIVKESARLIGVAKLAPHDLRNFDSVETREIQYAGGVRFPHLQPIPGSHDYLSEILAPRSDKEH